MASSTSSGTGLALGGRDSGGCDDGARGGRRGIGVVGSRGVVAAGHRLTAEAGPSAPARGKRLRCDGRRVGDGVRLRTGAVCPGAAGFAMIRDGASGVLSVLDFFAHTPLERRARRAWRARGRRRLRDGDAVVPHRAGDGGHAGLLRRGGGDPSDGGDDRPRPARRAGGRCRAAGIVVTPFQHHLSTVVAAILTATDGAADLFAPGGAVVGVGDVFRNPGLADALEILARDGFRGGAVGERCLRSQADRGHLTAADLEPTDDRAGAAVVTSVGRGSISTRCRPPAARWSPTRWTSSTGRTRLPSRAPLPPRVTARRDADGNLADLASLTVAGGARPTCRSSTRRDGMRGDGVER